MHLPFKYTLLVSTILFTAFAGAFGVVWYQIEIAATARQNLKLEKRISTLEVELSDVNRLIADYERPQSLMQLLAYHGSNLGPVAPARILEPGSLDGATQLGSEVSITRVNLPSLEPAESAPSRQPVYIRR